MVPFLMSLKDPNPDFKVTPLFDAEYLRNGISYEIHNYDGIVIYIFIMGARSA